MCALLTGRYPNEQCCLQVTFGSENLASRNGERLPTSNFRRPTPIHVQLKLTLSITGSLLLALTRISGICFGVLLSEITSVLIFPKSATGEALLLLRKSLKNLTELNAMAWQHGPLYRPGWESMQLGLEGYT